MALIQSLLIPEECFAGTQRDFLDRIPTFAATFVLLSCLGLLTSHQTPEKINMKCQAGFRSSDS